MAIKIEIQEKVGRLDRFLVSLHSEIPRSQWESWIRGGNVLVNGIPATKNGQILHVGNIVETELPNIAPPATYLIPEAMDLPTLYEDERLWIINKPMGMVVHPGPGHPAATVLNALLARIGSNAFSVEKQNENEDISEGDYEINQAWPGLVHRLDRYTSGCMAMAKDENAKTCLQDQFKARTVEKTYLAIARQSRKLPEIGSILISAPIARHRVDRTKMTIHSKGKEAHTRIKVISKSMGLALVACEILTGRTHQIRVHLSSIGAPLLGDPLYGGATTWQDKSANPLTCPYPALHSWKLSLDHPNGKRLNVLAELPDQFEQYIIAFGLQSF
ncbi:MAG: RluA family pseudouridine synthase [Holophagaceae bacterium]|nr:RluA family pseudouridine synthase [Holophagaceae bacterium]